MEPADPFGVSGSRRIKAIAIDQPGTRRAAESLQLMASSIDVYARSCPANRIDVARSCRFPDDRGIEFHHRLRCRVGATIHELPVRRATEHASTRTRAIGDCQVRRAFRWQRYSSPVQNCKPPSR